MSPAETNDCHKLAAEGLELVDDGKTIAARDAFMKLVRRLDAIEAREVLQRRPK